MESCNNNIHAASKGAHDKKVHVRVLGRGTRSKNKLQSPPQADSHRKPPTQSLSVWGGKWGQRTENVLELDQTAESSYRELERFVTDRKRAGACLRSPTVSP